MPTSATGPSRTPTALNRREAGFTLIEILIVVAIIAIATGAVMLQIRLPPSGDPATVAQRVAHTMQSALDEAIFNGRNLALTFSREGTAVLEYNEADRTWSRVKQPEGLADTISFSEVAPTIVIEGRQISLAPKLSGDKPDAFILSSGETSPFRMTLVAANNRGGPLAIVDVDPYGRVTLPPQPGG